MEVMLPMPPILENVAIKNTTEESKKWELLKDSETRRSKSYLQIGLKVKKTTEG